MIFRNVAIVVGIFVSVLFSQSLFAKNAEDFRKAAEQGNAKAQFELGYCYHFGEGVAKNDVESAKWYRKAAEQGNAFAQNNLGCCYAFGDGVGKDPVQAVKWFRKSAELGYKEAQYNLGCCYDSGNGVAVDKTEGLKWYRKAAEQGHADAQYNLGAYYHNGNGVEKDDVEAVKWLRKAAEQGDESAKAELKSMGVYADTAKTQETYNAVDKNAAVIDRIATLLKYYPDVEADNRFPREINEITGIIKTLSPKNIFEERVFKQVIFVDLYLTSGMKMLKLDLARAKELYGNANGKWHILRQIFEAQ